MKIGDSVIYRRDRSNYDSHGTVAEFPDNNMVKIEGRYGGFEIVPRHTCKSFQAIDQDELDQAHAEMLPKLVDMVRELFAKFLPTYTFEVQDGVIYCDNVSIDPCVVHRKSIVNVREIPGWSVNIETYDSGSRWDPPSSDCITVGEYHRYDLAAVEFVKTIVGCAMQQYLDNKMYDAMAEDTN
jgi:hypothetical protein